MHNARRVLPLLLSLCLGLAACSDRPDLPAHTQAALAAKPLTLAGPPDRKRLSVDPTVNVDALLNWAERTWAGLFPAGPMTQPLDANGQRWLIRSYPGTGNILGVAADGSVWGLGPFNGQVLTRYGHKDEFLCLVSPDRCGPPPACQTRIDTGFGGDLNAVYEAAGGGGATAAGATAVVRVATAAAVPAWVAVKARCSTHAFAPTGCATARCWPRASPMPRWAWPR